MRLYRYTEGEDQGGEGELLQSGEARVREGGRDRGHVEHQYIGEEAVPYEMDRRESKQRAAEDRDEDGDGDRDEDDEDLSAVRRRSF